MPLKLWIHAMLNVLEYWIFPPVCVLCGQAAAKVQDLCDGCQQGLLPVVHGCPRCQVPMPSLLAACSPCGSCLADLPPFRMLQSLFLYEFPATKMIADLKFHQRLVCARVLGEMMAKAVSQWYRDRPLPELIIPVPLHVDRLKERGFNQALVIAKYVATSLALAIDDQACLRVKATVAQASLSKRKRAKNVKQAFKIVKPLSVKHVAVIDDVVTTGYTIRELCRVLQRAGIETIDVWCCARAGIN